MNLLSIDQITESNKDHNHSKLQISVNDDTLSEE